MEITAKSYFSGAGGMDLGIEEAGINILESFEIDNPYKFKENRLYVFNLIIEGNRVGTKEMADFCDGNNLLHVPIISTEYYLPKTMEEMKLEADGYSEINPKVRREGYVYRSQDGQQSFKNVSREYLLKHNG